MYDREGNKHYPREGFIVPLDIIQEAVQLIVDGEIDKYMYNSEMQLIVRK